MWETVYLFFRLICFTFVSSTTLEEFLKEGSDVAGVDGLVSVMLDVIKAIEHLHKIGICHNDVTAPNVLISFSEGVGNRTSDIIIALLNSFDELS